MKGRKDISVLEPIGRARPDWLVDRRMRRSGKQANVLRQLDKVHFAPFVIGLIQGDRGSLEEVKVQGESRAASLDSQVGSIVETDGKGRIRL
jgi:hypothetical protein